MVVIVGIFVWRYFSGKTAVNEQVGGENNGQIIGMCRLYFHGKSKTGKICKYWKDCFK